MPIDKMDCKKCGTQWEWFRLVSKELPQCPKCGECNEVEKAFPTRTGFVTKGKGWFNSGGY